MLEIAVAEKRARHLQTTPRFFLSPATRPFLCFVVSAEQSGWAIIHSAVFPQNPVRGAQ
jgi:hypothetical protein